MALFSLTDIKFSSKQRTGKASSTLAGSSYETDVLRYPLDIGNYDKGHYMVIHINEQMQTSYSNNTGQDDPTVIANRKRFGTPTVGGNLAAVGGLAGDVISKTGKLGETVKSGYETFVKESGTGQMVDQMVKNASNVRGVRTLRRTTDTIALYMPDTMNFTNNQQYSDLTMGLPGQVLAGGASLAQSLKSNKPMTGDDVVRNLSPFFISKGLPKALGSLGTVLAVSGLGVVENPMLEILYTSPSFRSFRFDFMFYPRSEKEAQEVQNILSKLQFHQAPEIRKESNGYFMVPPSEFDIKFYYNGAENPNIPSISTCVLESIDVDYAPNGFSAYEVPGELTASTGRTGMPVAIRLSLQFKETEIMTKDNFAEAAQKGRLKSLTEEISKVNGGATKEQWLTDTVSAKDGGMGNYGE